MEDLCNSHQGRSPGSIPVRAPSSRRVCLGGAGGGILLDAEGPDGGGAVDAGAGDGGEDGGCAG